MKCCVEWLCVCFVGLMVDVGDLIVMCVFFEDNFMLYWVVKDDGMDSGFIIGYYELLLCGFCICYGVY